MKTLLCATSICLLLLPAVAQSQDIMAVTEDGRTVILKKNGTWRPYDAASAQAPATPASRETFKKSDSATAVFRSKGDRFMVWYNPAKWRQKKSADPDKTTYEHTDGDVYAMILAERFSMSLEALRDLAISNARTAAPDVRLSYEEERVVNGKRILCLKFDGTISGVPFTYYGYYYAGKSGIIQLITYTAQNLVEEYEGEMTEFLNGLKIKE